MKMVIRFSWDKGIIVGYPEDYNKLTNAEYIWVNLAGIFAGCFILILFLEGWILLIMVCLYFLGCQTDMNNILSGRGKC